MVGVFQGGSVHRNAREGLAEWQLYRPVGLGTSPGWQWIVKNWRTKSSDERHACDGTVRWRRLHGIVDFVAFFVCHAYNRVMHRAG
jgi:hypothetical protein